MTHRWFNKPEDPHGDKRKRLDPSGLRSKDPWEWIRPEDELPVYRSPEGGTGKPRSYLRECLTITVSLAILAAAVGLVAYLIGTR